jgi:precorrin-2 dehydrogenase/sirohydrochlorin ferrochelatase
MLLYPVNLNINEKLCLVIGGGAVALRKIRSLLDGGASVRVISPVLEPELKVLARRREIDWIERGFVEGDLKGAFLVFAATDNRAVQDQIMEESAKYSVLINSADDPPNSQFHVPAHFRRGQMLVTVSTGGGSPALAKNIRLQLEKEIAPEYEAVVELLSQIRNRVVSQDNNFLSHAELFRRLLQQGIVEQVLGAQWFDLQMMLLQELPESVDAVALMKQFLQKYDKSGC